MGFVGAVVALGTDILAAGGVLYFIKQPRRMVFSNVQVSTRLSRRIQARAIEARRVRC